MFPFLLLYVTVLYIRPSEIVPALARVPLVDILTIGSVPVVALASMMRPRRFVILPADLCVLGFWAVIVISNLAWGWFGGAWMGFLQFMPIVFCYFLVRIALHTPREFRVFVYLLVLLNVFQAVNGIVQYHTGVGLGGVLAVGGEENRIRGTGIFNDPNDLGMTLVMVTPFMVCGLFAARARVVTRLLWLALLAPTLLAMYYTNSRGTIIGLGAVLVVFCYRHFNSVLATVVAVVGLAGLVAFGPSRAGAIDASENSAQTRVEAWGEGLGMLKANPVFGVGYGRFTEFHHKVAHNSFVHTFSELGLVGAVLLVGMFYGFFRALRLLETANADDIDAQYWSRALALSAIGAIVCGYFLSRQYIVVPYILLAMGLSRASAGLAGARPFWSNLPVQAATTLGATAAGVAVVWVSVRALGAW